MAMYAKIRRMYFREHLTISEIQRAAQVCRATPSGSGSRKLVGHAISVLNATASSRHSSPRSGSRWKPTRTGPGETGVRRS